MQTMKGIYVIAIIFVASWSIVIASGYFDQDKSESIWEQDVDKIPTKCPLIDVNGTVVHLAHETDCTKAYKCSWGKRYLFDCPWIDERKTQRLHFNIYKQYCDWPEQAGCIECPRNNGGYLPAKLSYDNNSCSQYYNCVNGLKQLNFCSSGFCFSATCQTCIRNRTGGNCD
ncbi:uncharacterized protein [Anoplolepis gracilipes]|uniref:uncharacterized protein n=1 Tax=Anoplolepis gracilipes TaxID=354296 RepID=UPI003BA243AF